MIAEDNAYNFIFYTFEMYRLFCIVYQTQDSNRVLRGIR